jgi:hypothetical protein
MEAAAPEHRPRITGDRVATRPTLDEQINAFDRPHRPATGNVVGPKRGLNASTYSASIANSDVFRLAS